MRETRAFNARFLHKLSCRKLNLNYALKMLKMLKVRWYSTTSMVVGMIGFQMGSSRPTRAYHPLKTKNRSGNLSRKLSKHGWDDYHLHVWGSDCLIQWQLDGIRCQGKFKESLPLDISGQRERHHFWVERGHLQPLVLTGWNVSKLFEVKKSQAGKVYSGVQA